MDAEATVFIIDDDPAVLRSLAALVRVAHPRVETFATAEEFLAHCDFQRPGCLLLDVVLPGVGGLELHRRLQAAGAEWPVIFITGYGTVPAAVDAMRNGAMDFLEKPLRDEALWQAIRRALERDEAARRERACRAMVAARLAKLSEGENQVLDLMLTGKTNREIAKEARVSVRTVEDRRARVMRKMEAGSLVELVQLVALR
jgi:FixJ family two-component response regulator